MIFVYEYGNIGEIVKNNKMFIYSIYCILVFEYFEMLSIKGFLG